MTTLKVARGPDGQTRYTTVDGDIVDHVCWRHYGREWGTTEAVLAVNPRLALRGAILPAGVSILLPVIAAEDTSRRDTIRLFDD